MQGVGRASSLRPPRLSSFLPVAASVFLFEIRLSSCGCAGRRAFVSAGLVLCVLQSAAIIASRKHYSVDVVVAWWVHRLRVV